MPFALNAGTEVDDAVLDVKCASAGVGTAVVVAEEADEAVILDLDEDVEEDRSLDRQAIWMRGARSRTDEMAARGLIV